jgi:hypothetical protein
MNVQIQGIAAAQAALQAQVQPFFTQVIASVVDGVGHLKSVVIDTLSVGSPELPSGITLYDTVTKQPYCLQVANGQTVSVPGICGALPNAPATIITTTGTGATVVDTGTATATVLMTTDATAATSAATSQQASTDAAALVLTTSTATVVPAAPAVTDPAPITTATSGSTQ